MIIRLSVTNNAPWINGSPIIEFYVPTAALTFTEKRLDKSGSENWWYPNEKDVLRIRGSTLATKLFPETSDRSYEGNWPNKCWDIKKSIFIDRFIKPTHK